jgi:hypothetical protein
MRTALWIIAFAQMYNIVEAWVWAIHWRLKGKKEFEERMKDRDRSTDLESLLALYSNDIDELEERKNGK